MLHVVHLSPTFHLKGHEMFLHRGGGYGEKSAGSSVSTVSTTFSCQLGLFQLLLGRFPGVRGKDKDEEIFR